MQEQMFRLIMEAVLEINENLDEKLDVDAGLACKLYGDGGHLDSISLVSLIVNVEQRVEDAFDVSIILANEKAMSQKNSPFLSIESLTNYAMTLVEEEKQNDA